MDKVRRAKPKHSTATGTPTKSRLIVVHEREISEAEVQQWLSEPLRKPLPPGLDPLRDAASSASDFQIPFNPDDAARLLRLDEGRPC